MQKNLNGDTALHVAATRDTGIDLQLVRHLTSIPTVNMDITNNEGNTPLHCALSMRRRESSSSDTTLVVRKLMSMPNVDINVFNGLHETSLLMAAKNERWRAADVLLASPRIDVDVSTARGDTLLHFVARSGKLYLLQSLSKSIVDKLLNRANNGKYTPILSAANKQCWNIVKHLLTMSKTDVSVSTTRGETLLQLAASNGKLEIIKLLATNFKDCLSEVNSSAKTLLSAAHNEHWKVVEYLLTIPGVDVNVTDPKQNTLLHIASAAPHLRSFEVVKTVLLNPKVNINAVNDKGETPLFLVVSRDDFEQQILSLFVAYFNGDLRQEQGIFEAPLALNKRTVYQMLTSLDKTTTSGDSGLLSAAKHMHWNAIEYLLTAPCYDYNALTLGYNRPDETGNTLLGRASAHGSVRVVKALLAISAVNVNGNANNETPPVLSAASNHHWETVGIFMTHANERVDFSATNSKGDSLLHVAATQGRDSVVSKLCKHCKVDVNATNNDGNTPVLAAARVDHWDVVDQFFTFSAVDMSVQNNAGYTLMHYAALGGKLGVVKRLLRCLPNIEVDAMKSNLFGNTPLHFATRNGHCDIVATLIDKLPNIDTIATNIHDETPYDICKQIMHGSAMWPYHQMGNDFLPDTPAPKCSQYGGCKDDTDSGWHHHLCPKHLCGFGCPGVDKDDDKVASLSVGSRMFLDSAYSTIAELLEGEMPT